MPNDLAQRLGRRHQRQLHDQRRHTVSIHGMDRLGQRRMPEPAWWRSAVDGIPLHDPHRDAMPDGLDAVGGCRYVHHGRNDRVSDRMAGHVEQRVHLRCERPHEAVPDRHGERLVSAVAGFCRFAPSSQFRSHM